MPVANPKKLNKTGTFFILRNFGGTSSTNPQPSEFLDKVGLTEFVPPGIWGFETVSLGATLDDLRHSGLSFHTGPHVTRRGGSNTG